jgi:hypothetical protein
MPAKTSYEFSSREITALQVIPDYPRDRGIYDFEGTRRSPETSWWWLGGNGGRSSGVEDWLSAYRSASSRETYARGARGWQVRRPWVDPRTARRPDVDPRRIHLEEAQCGPGGRRRVQPVRLPPRRRAPTEEPGITPRKARLSQTSGWSALRMASNWLRCPNHRMPSTANVITYVSSVGSTSRSRSAGPSGTRTSSTIRVMTMAKTPSPSASTRRVEPSPAVARTCRSPTAPSVSATGRSGSSTGAEAARLRRNLRGVHRIRAIEILGG